MVGLIGIVCMLGTLISSKKIEGELVDIGFSDKDGNPPILISRLNENKGIRLEFYSPKISFVKYEDHISEIETALNIKVVDIRQEKIFSTLLLEPLSQERRVRK